MSGVSLRRYWDKHNGLVSCISVGFALPILLTMGNARASIRGVGNKSNSTLFVCLYVSFYNTTLCIRSSCIGKNYLFMLQLQITRTAKGWSANQEISKELFIGKTCLFLTVCCQSPYYGAAKQLMDETCEFLNSLGLDEVNVKTDYVVTEQKSRSDANGHYIEELTFQIIF